MSAAGWAAELPPHMVGTSLLEAYRTPLLQFVADWNRSSAKPAMIEQAPVDDGADPYLLPSIASVVHALAERHDLPVPDWVWGHNSRRIGCCSATPQTSGPTSGGER